jgi:hypothetical protein
MAMGPNTAVSSTVDGTFEIEYTARTTEDSLTVTASNQGNIIASTDPINVTMLEIILDQEIIIMAPGDTTAITGTINDSSSDTGYNIALVESVSGNVVVTGSSDQEVISLNYTATGDEGSAMLFFLAIMDNSYKNVLVQSTTNVTVSLLTVAFDSSSYLASTLSAITISGTINDTSKTFYVRLTDSDDNSYSDWSSLDNGSNTWSFSYTPSSDLVLGLTVELYTDEGSSTPLASSTVAVSVLTTAFDSSSYLAYTLNPITISGTINDTSKSYKVRLTDSLDNSTTATSSLGSGSNTWSLTYTPTSSSVSGLTVRLYESTDTTYLTRLASSTATASVLTTAFDQSSYAGEYSYFITISGFINDTTQAYRVRLADKSIYSGVSTLNNNNNTWSWYYDIDSSSISVSHLTVRIYLLSDTTYSTPLAESTVSTKFQYPSWYTTH